MRLSRDVAVRAAALALRAEVFRCGGDDADAFDDRCLHGVVENDAAGRVLACFRVMPLASGEEIDGCYAAQYYALDRLKRLEAPLLELGRFCVAPGVGDPDVLRLAWGRLTRAVEDHGAAMLFGCSSLPGTDAPRHGGVLGFLGAHHAAPADRALGVKAPETVRLDRFGTGDHREALRAMPPLLRTYLAMGGWVSDHAVIDRDLGTIHVFTGLEVAAVPASRVRSLRATMA